MLKSLLSSGNDCWADKNSQQETHETQLTIDSRPTYESSPIPEGHAFPHNHTELHRPDAGHAELPALPETPVHPVPEVQSSPAEVVGRDGSSIPGLSNESPSGGHSKKRRFEQCATTEDHNIEKEVDTDTIDDIPEPDSQRTDRSFISDISTRDSLIRQDAYQKMEAYARGGECEGIALLSTNGGHTIMEKELGRPAEGEPTPVVR